MSKVTDLELMGLSLLAYYDFNLNENAKENTVAELVTNKESDFEFSDKHVEAGWQKTDLKALDGYTIIAQQANTSTGFAGLAAKSPSGEIVFAFRGTEFEEDKIKDGLIQDLLVIGAGLDIHNQFDDARKFVKETLNISMESDLAQSLKDMNTNLVFTGHSLGGGIAEQMVLQTYKTGQTRGVTYNAVGTKQTNSIFDRPLNDEAMPIRGIKDPRDLVGQLGFHYGDEVFTATKETEKYLAQMNQIYQDLNEKKITEDEAEYRMEVLSNQMPFSATKHHGMDNFRSAFCFEN